VSEYYEARRTNIADITGLVGMGIGALVASLSTLRILATGFRTGHMERALLTFGSIVIGVSAVSGLMGLAVGRWVGARWEHRHRARRHAPADDAATTPASTDAIFTVRPLSQEAQHTLALTMPNVPEGTWIGLWQGATLVAVAANLAHVVLAPGFDERVAREQLTAWMQRHARA
jgi:hypothetical protein